MWFQLTMHCMERLAIWTSCSISSCFPLASSFLTKVASSKGSCRCRNSFLRLFHSEGDMVGSRCPNFSKLGVTVSCAGESRSALLSRRFWSLAGADCFQGSRPYRISPSTCVGFPSRDDVWTALVRGIWKIDSAAGASRACRHRRRQARQLNMKAGVEVVCMCHLQLTPKKFTSGSWKRAERHVTSRLNIRTTFGYF